MTVENINKLLDERDKLIEEEADDNLIDFIQQGIVVSLKENFDDYTFDFIFETYTRFGHAPNLIYDDNGKFAISGSGMQPVVFGDELIDGAVTVFVEKEQWFKTVREALWYYMNN